MLKPRHSNYNLECGVDEAGRGCLAGPVTAAAVILKANFKHDLIDDSKKLSETAPSFPMQIITPPLRDARAIFLFGQQLLTISNHLGLYHGHCKSIDCICGDHG